MLQRAVAVVFRDGVQGLPRVAAHFGVDWLLDLEGAQQLVRALVGPTAELRVLRVLNKRVRNHSRVVVVVVAAVHNTHIANKHGSNNLCKEACQP